MNHIKRYETFLTENTQYQTGLTPNKYNDILNRINFKINIHIKGYDLSYNDFNKFHKDYYSGNNADIVNKIYNQYKKDIDIITANLNENFTIKNILILATIFILGVSCEKENIQPTDKTNIIELESDTLKHNNTNNYFNNDNNNYIKFDNYVVSQSIETEENHRSLKQSDNNQDQYNPIGGYTQNTNFINKVNDNVIKVCENFKGDQYVCEMNKNIEYYNIIEYNNLNPNKQFFLSFYAWTQTNKQQNLITKYNLIPKVTIETRHGVKTLNKMDIYRLYNNTYNDSLDGINTNPSSYGFTITDANYVKIKISYSVENSLNNTNKSYFVLNKNNDKFDYIMPVCNTKLDEKK